MKIKLGELEIPKDDPFTNDQLRRQDLEPPLTELVCQTQGPYVLAMNGRWGTGKTTFIQMWRHKLVERGCPVLYFNAWETDFSLDPLAALVAELSREIESVARGESDGPKAKRIERVKKLASSITKRALPAAARLATSGLLDLDAIQERELSSLAGRLVEDQIAEYERSRSEIAEFRSLLAKLIEETAGDAQPVVVFVDELDRCRPNYAVELLERVKHLFNVPGLVFVLGVDKEQLSHSIRGLYGGGFDAETYLRRFIDLEYVLPGPPKGSRFCRTLLIDLGIYDWLSRTNRGRGLRELEGMLQALFDLTRMSLREQSQALGRLHVVLRTIPQTEEIYGSSLASAIFLREWAHDLYDVVSSGHVEDFLKRLEGVPGGSSFFSSRIGIRLEVELICWELEQLKRSDRLESHKEQQADENSSAQRRSRKVVEWIGIHGDEGWQFGWAIEKLCLTSPFVVARD
ncbi:MAG: P-loop NTPase fold protein [Acidobacteriota bacterium]